MLIGIYGGSFDPIHNGHAMVASYLAQWCEFDQIWLMVSPRNPLKEKETCIADESRLEMAKIVANHIDGVEVSDFEFSMPRPSYMRATLDALSQKYPQHHFRLIIGSDNWDVFEKWKDPDYIINNFGVTVYPRPGYPKPSGLPSGVEWLDEAPQMLISSSFIRKSIEEGKNIRYFVPDEIATFIDDKMLYGRGDTLPTT